MSLHDHAMHSMTEPDCPSPRRDQNPGPNRVTAGGRCAEWTGWWRDRASAGRSGDAAERLATGQGFVLSRAQARGCGLTDAAIRRRVRSGTWSVPHRGVLAVAAVPSAPPGDRDRVRLAQRRRLALACTATALANPGQTVSGNCAALLYGLPLRRDPVRPQLTTAPVAQGAAGNPSITQGHRTAGLVRAATLRPAELGTWFGAPVTSPARTLVDLARHSRQDGLIAADAALYEGLVSSADIDRALARACGWPGVRRARQVLALASGLAESPLESLTRLAIHDSGLPMPELQRWVEAFGQWYRVDMIWPEQRLIVEADGRLKYTGESEEGDPLWQEKVREEYLGRVGYTVVRVLWSDVVRFWPRTRDRIMRGLSPSAFPLV